ncbi:MAG: anti-sigma factor [Rubrobacteraceae bacterium]
MSEHQETRDLLGPFLMGDLSAEDERMVEEHLEDCASCREEVDSLRLAHERLAEFAAVVEPPPPRLKDRAVGGIPRPAARRFVPPSWLVAAAAALLVALGVAYGTSLLGGGEVAAATLEPTGWAPEAGGELRVESPAPNTQARLEVWNLPRLEEGEYYELWFGKGEGRISAGTFTVDERGNVTSYMHVTQETVGDYQRVGITLEKFPAEPRMDRARVVLGGELRES